MGIDPYGREVNVNRSGVVFFSEIFVQLCVGDVGDVVFVFIIISVQLRMRLFDDECGDVIVFIWDCFPVGDETGQRIGLGIRITLFEIDLDVKF